MKKLILIAIIATVTLSAYSGPVVTDYVVTEDGVTYFTKVRYGTNAYLVCKNEDGSKVKYRKNEIISYRKSGEVFQKKQVFIKGKPCEDCDFLKLLKTKHGFSIYMFQKNDVNGNLNKLFYVYKDDKFVLEINKDNYLQMMDFFTKS